MSSKIKFYTDEHIPRAVVKALKQHGIDVLTTGEAGMMGATDEAHLRLANSLGRVMITEDDDYLALDASGMPHKGIAFAQPYTPIGEMTEGLFLVYEALDTGEIEGRVHYL